VSLERIHTFGVCTHVCAENPFGESTARFTNFLLGSLGVGLSLQARSITRMCSSAGCAAAPLGCASAHLRLWPQEPSVGAILPHLRQRPQSHVASALNEGAFVHAASDEALHVRPRPDESWSDHRLVRCLSRIRDPLVYGVRNCAHSL